MPHSIDQAGAYFKAGDCQFALTNLAAASTNYWQSATNYLDLPGVQRGFADHALYQIVRCALGLDDLRAADAAMRLILEWYPESYFGDRSLLWLGQALGAQGKPAEAPEGRVALEG